MDSNILESVYWVNTPFNTSYGVNAKAYSFSNSVHRQGTSNPGFRAQIANGTNASTAYSRTEIKLSGKPKWEVIFGNPAKTLGMGITPLVTPTPVLFSGDCGIDLRKKYSEVMDQQNAILLVAEDMREFRGMIGDMADKTQHYADQVHRRLDYHLRGVNNAQSMKKLSRLNAQNIVSEFSDLWLSYNFGISPLLGSAESLARSTARVLAGHQANEIIVSIAKDSSESFVGNYTTLGSYYYQGGDVVCSRKTNWAASAKYTLGVNPSLALGLGGAASVAGLSSLASVANGIACTAWELVPYSWVIDYFTNAGGYIDAISNTSSIGGLVYGCLSTKSVVTDSYWPWFLVTSWSQYNTYNTKLIAANPGSVTTSRFERSPIASFPMPDLRFKTLKEVGAGNPAKKLANLFAVIGGKSKLLGRMLG